MIGFRFIFGCVVALVLGLSAIAAEPKAIRDQISSGDFTAAFQAAEVMQTADGYALAAECLLSEIMLGDAKKNKKQAKKARKIAKSALKLDPSHQHARLQYAIADGFVTRETSDVSAWMKKLPQKTLAIVQQYRTDFPDDPRGDALLGAWHLAIVRKTGNKNAKKWFEASHAEGRELYIAARAKIEKDPVIDINYAFALIALDDELVADVEEARAILNVVVDVPLENHLERVLQSYAREALDRLDDREAARSYVGLFLDGKRPQ